jgi:4-hydroxybenzoate polyprenyltransferase/phosphoserine phosphatase
LNSRPLIVDLDGTLIWTDLLHESVLKALHRNPLDLFRLGLWLGQGKAQLKEQLARRTRFDAALLPYNEEFLAWLAQEKAKGRSLVLCTASDSSFAQAIAAHLGLFDAVMASDGVINLAGTHKAKALVDKFGAGGFDYAGNSMTDCHVWRSSAEAVVVNAPSAVLAAAQKLCPVERVFQARPCGLSVWRRVLRAHQWLKNLLLFVPLVAAHQLSNSTALSALLLAFIAFSLCASSVYILNDLLDIDSDRAHPHKKHRPFASGLVPISYGVVLAPLLLIASFAIAAWVPHVFVYWLIGYFVLTCAYSWRLKSWVLVDCLILAVLYTLRVIAGAAAASIFLSFWILAFSVFLFLSLAFVKRYAELMIAQLSGKDKAMGRGYLTTDAPLIQALGVGAAYASVVVLALYLNSDAVRRLYQTPEIVWGAVLVVLFWISWMWLQAHRGKMNDDPLVFAVKDKASLLAGAAFAGVLALGSVKLQW